MLTEIDRFDGGRPDPQCILLDNLAEGGRINYDGAPIATLYLTLPNITSTIHRSVYGMWLDSRIEYENKRQSIVGYSVTLICLLICIAAVVFF